MVSLLFSGKSRNESEQTLKSILDVIDKGGLPVHHTLGNHDLYNFSHATATERIIRGSHAVPSHSRNTSYYSFTTLGFRFISLDCYDVSYLGRTKEEPSYKEAMKYLKLNTNSDLNSSVGLSGTDKRFVTYNGAIGEEQMKWLSDELHQAEQRKERVVVFGKCM